MHLVRQVGKLEEPLVITGGTQAARGGMMVTNYRAKPWQVGLIVS